LLLKVDKRKVFDAAAKHFSMNGAQRTMLEGVYDHLMSEEQK